MTGSNIKSHQRSPSYPAINLIIAIDKINELYSNIGCNLVHADSILETLGYTLKSGQGHLVIAALRKFGLLTYESKGSSLKGMLTDLALRIVLDERENTKEKEDAIREAALEPEIHKELLEHYNYNLPDDNSIKYYLVMDKGFSDIGAKKFINEFRTTIEFAKVQNNDNISPDVTDIGVQESQTPPSILEVIDKNKEGDIMNPRTDTNNNANDTEIMDFPIPLSLKSAVIIRSSFPMSEDDWTLMIGLLNSYKHILIKKAKKRENNNANDID